MKSLIKVFAFAVPLAVTTGVVATVLLAAPAQAKILGGAVKGITVTQKNTNIYSALSVQMTWCVPNGEQAGDTFTLGLPPQLIALTKGFPLNDPSGKNVANATVAGGLATFTLTAYVATHRDVCGTAHFDEAFNVGAVQANTPTTVQFASGNTVFSAVITPRQVIAKRAKAIKYGSWADATDEDRISPSGALHWLMDSPQAPAGGYSKVVFTDTSGPGQAFDCSRLNLSIGTVNAVGGFQNGVAVDKSHYLTQCSGSAVKVTASTLVSRGKVMHLYLPTTVTDSTLPAYTDSGSVAVNGRPAQSVTAQPILRTSAGGNGVGTLNALRAVVKSSPVAATTVPPATATKTAAPTATKAATIAPTSGGATPAALAVTQGVEAVAATAPPTAVALAAGTLAATGSRSQTLLELAFGAIALGSLAMFAARRFRRAPRGH
ncbi:MAG: hypothetical protein JWO63_3304 [Frankiales bacterium]|nr:hypothetical protein [Frankiales bacterium]